MVGDVPVIEKLKVDDDVPVAVTEAVVVRTNAACTQAAPTSSVTTRAAPANNLIGCTFNNQRP